MMVRPRTWMRCVLRPRPPQPNPPPASTVVASTRTRRSSMSYADPYAQDADRRRADLARKLSLLRSLLLELQADALLLSYSANVAWLTNGARTYVNMATEGGVGSIYVDASSVRVLTNEIEGHRLLNEELRGLEPSFSVHEDPWHAQRPHPQVASEIAAAATGNTSPKVLVDASSAELAGRLSRLRVKLSDYEMDAFRSLGAECGRVIGEVAHSVKPGMSEWEAASALAAGLLEKEITPVVLLVAADERADAIRHPLPTQKRVKNKLMLVLCGRRHGLVCSATRMVYLTKSPDEKIPEELLRRHDAATYVDAVAIAASRHVGTPANEVLMKIQDAYAAKGFPDEWTKHHQGGCAAFLSREWVANPTLTDRVVETSMAFAWNPSVAGTKSEDTILVTQRGDGAAEVEVISQTPDWPMLEHEVDGQTITRPAILHLKF